MGVGTTRTFERIAASIGLLNNARPDFKEIVDVSSGGVIFALPALLAQGLLKHTDKFFQLPEGFYGIESIFLLLSFMALARIKSAEQLRYCSPGEWGKILGLDRIPEVRTLRKKIEILSDGNNSKYWNAELCRDWMEGYSNLECGFYIDGHVRVYHGGQTKLPYHYVSRQKLCLRATSDYWVNAMDGQPFFLVNKAIDPGLIKTLQEDIVPQLLRDVPNQPSEEVLLQDKYLHKFIMIFDREGYSPEFFLKMKIQRIACISYHKHPGENWPLNEFSQRQITHPTGDIEEVMLAERGTFLGDTLWVREIRKLSQNQHQTSILSTDFKSSMEQVAISMFSRWSQENFFRYMKEHFSLDHLVDYGLEKIPENTKIVNPDYRKLNTEIKSKTTSLSRKLAEFGAIVIEDEIEEKNIEKFSKKKASLQDEITHLEKEIEELKNNRKTLKQHIEISELPDDQKFNKLKSQTKHFMDTIKMISYRAETSMAHILKEKLSRQQDVRSHLRSIFNTDVDISPNFENKTLTVKLHHLAQHCSDEALLHLCKELNETNTIFPGTNLQIVYDLVSNINPLGQDI